MEAWTSFIARVLIALLFLVSGIRQAIHRDNVRRDMESHAIPATGALLAAAIAVELIGGLGLVLGYRVEWAAGALAGFTALSTLLYYRDLRDRESLLHCLKNLAIIGGLILVATHGAGG